MKLQLLVPQYNETEKEIKPLLDSLAIQQNVNFKDIGVIICNDGSDVHLSKKFLKSYPFKIEYYLCEHQGVSATRNACLDHATADYVMFCDADDMFLMNCALWIIFREMDVGFDSMTSAFVEETRFGDIVDYITHDVDSTFVHGKVHRRDYLIEKDIRWNPKLTIHEDSYFNILCQNLSDSVKYYPTPFYLWKWRDNSVCRHDPKYILKTYSNMIDSNSALLDEFMQRGKEDKAITFCCTMVLDAYYTMNKPEWINQENKEYRDATELHFAQYFKKWQRLWDDASPQEKIMMSNQIRQRNIGEGMRFEAKTIDDWLKHIKKLSRQKK